MPEHQRTRSVLPLYVLLATIIAWTNPLVMLAFSQVWKILAIEYWLAIPSFFHPGSNTDQINLTAFLPAGSLLYYAWVRSQVAFFSKRRPHFSPRRFLASKALGNIPACAVGAINLWVFAKDGMEGNVFGFLFALPLLVVVLVSIVVWIVQTIRASRGHFDLRDPSAT